VTPEERSTAEELLAHYGIEAGDELIVLNPGAAFGSTKLWPVEHWARLAERLHAARVQAGAQPAAHHPRRTR
jgi:ADP-heptose:LPS heptosyltransferase